MYYSESIIRNGITLISLIYTCTSSIWYCFSAVRLFKRLHVSFLLLAQKPQKRNMQPFNKGVSFSRRSLQPNLQWLVQHPRFRQQCDPTCFRRCICILFVENRFLLRSLGFCRLLCRQFRTNQSNTCKYNLGSVNIIGDWPSFHEYGHWALCNDISSLTGIMDTYKEQTCAKEIFFCKILPKEGIVWPKKNIWYGDASDWSSNSCMLLLQTMTDSHIGICQSFSKFQNKNIVHSAQNLNLLSFKLNFSIIFQRSGKIFHFFTQFFRLKYSFNFYKSQCKRIDCLQDQEFISSELYFSTDKKLQGKTHGNTFSLYQIFNRFHNEAQIVVKTIVASHLFSKI